MTSDPTSTSVIDLYAVYAAAGIETPSHGYGADRLDRLLNSPHLASFTFEDRARVVRAAMEAAGVAPSDIIEEVERRQAALVDMAREKSQAIESLRMENEQRAQDSRMALEGFLRGKNEQIEELRKASSLVEHSFEELRQRKKVEEDRLARLMSYLLQPFSARSGERSAVRAPEAPKPEPTKGGNGKHTSPNTDRVPAVSGPTPQKEAAPLVDLAANATKPPTPAASSPKTAEVQAKVIGPGTPVDGLPPLQVESWGEPQSTAAPDEPWPLEAEDESAENGESAPLWSLLEPPAAKRPRSRPQEPSPTLDLSDLAAGLFERGPSDKKKGGR